jgi:cytochrome b561
MVELDYYHAWYRRAPAWHKSFGLLLFGVMLIRVAWRYSSPAPEPLGTDRQRRIASAAHRLLYLLLFAIVISGYLISTADGRPVEVFGLFSIPATISGLDGQEDIAGKVHQLLAFALIALAGVHALAALKHHFIDHDATLRRMLGGNSG